MKALIVGYGSMGHEVEKVLLDRGHTVVARVDAAAKADAAAVTEDLASRAEVAIEFTAADAVIGNAALYARYGLSAVTGSTGWYGRLEELKKALASGNIGYVYGSNFSIGAHVFFALVREAARLSNACPEYDILGYEIHHRRKKDSPSGTALSIAKIINQESRRQKKTVTERLDRAVKPEELHFASLRGGEFPGVHTVLLDSLADTIELKHSARSRGGFALGAVRAAEWILGRKGLYEVDDFIRDILKGGKA